MQTSCSKNRHFFTINVISILRYISKYYSTRGSPWANVHRNYILLGWARLGQSGSYMPQ